MRFSVSNLDIHLILLSSSFNLRLKLLINKSKRYNYTREDFWMDGGGALVDCVIKFKGVCVCDCLGMWGLGKDIVKVMYLGI